jgi:parallel beta-helix repeat protein
MNYQKLTVRILFITSIFVLSSCGSTPENVFDESLSTSQGGPSNIAENNGPVLPGGNSTFLVPSPGESYFVDPSGSNGNDGSEGSPWQTIQFAVDNVQPGDTILLQSGSYVGARAENSGTEDAWISLKAAPGATVVVNKPGPNNKHESVLEFENWEGDETIAYWLVEGLEVADAPYWGIDVRGNETNHSHHFVIRNNRVHDNGLDTGKTGIFFAFVDDVVAEGNESFANGEHGIYLSNSGDRFEVRGNILHENNNCGLHMNGDLESGEDGIISDGVVENNIIFENGEGGCAGINMDGVTNAIIRNNLLYENHASGIALFQENGAVCSQNIQVLNNTIVQADDARWAIYISDEECVDIKIFNNIILTFHERRGSIVIPVDNVDGFESDNNIVMDRFSADDDDSVVSLSEWQSLGFDTNSIIAAPSDIFADLVNYRLHAASPAVDAGQDVQNLANDLEGTNRPLGAGFDIGALEFSDAPIGNVNGSSQATGSSDGPHTGKITYFYDGNAFLLSAQEGAEPLNISEELDNISPGGGDGLVNISPDGEWLILETERFDSECVDWACLSIIASDFSSGEIIRAGGEIIRAEGIAAIASGGDLVVFAFGDGPNDFDLWAVSRNGDGWNTPILLTGDSPFSSNFQMSISGDGSTVLFNCGTDPYGGDDTSICEVGTDGTGFRIILSPNEVPPGFSLDGGLYQPDYAPDGSIVFEADWEGEQIWRLPAGASVAVRVTNQFDSDNSPCVLPDGRIVSLSLNREGSGEAHEIKIMSSDGTDFYYPLPTADITDAGMGCGL